MQQLKKTTASPIGTEDINRSHSSDDSQQLALHSDCRHPQEPVLCSLNWRHQRSNVHTLPLQVLRPASHCNSFAAALAARAAASYPVDQHAAAAPRSEWPMTLPFARLCLCNSGCRCYGNAACPPACCIQRQRSAALLRCSIVKIPESEKDVGQMGPAIESSLQTSHKHHRTPTQAESPESCTVCEASTQKQYSKHSRQQQAALHSTQ
jgi:hypothetical protein